MKARGKGRSVPVNCVELLFVFRSLHNRQINLLARGPKIHLFRKEQSSVGLVLKVQTFAVLSSTAVWGPVRMGRVLAPAGAFPKIVKCQVRLLKRKEVLAQLGSSELMDRGPQPPSLHGTLRLCLDPSRCQNVRGTVGMTEIWTLTF